MKKLCRNQKIHAKNSNRIFIVDSLIHAGSGQGDIYKVHAGKDVYAMKLFHNGNEQKIRRLQDFGTIVESVVLDRRSW